MPLLDLPCPYDGEPLEISVTLLGDPPLFGLAVSPAFVAHMTGKHGARMIPPEVWPPEETA